MNGLDVDGLDGPPDVDGFDVERPTWTTAAWTISTLDSAARDDVDGERRQRARP